MHSIVWFCTTGIHDPSWVQAVAASALVVLTLVTLAVLAVYTWDTHTLAKVSVEQIKLVKEEHSFETMRRSQAAYDLIFMTNDNVRRIGQSLVDGTFGAKPQLRVYPSGWPDATTALVHRKAGMAHPLITFGVSLRAVDLAVEAFAEASNIDDKRRREAEVRKAVGEAAKNCASLIDAMKEL